MCRFPRALLLSLLPGLAAAVRESSSRAQLEAELGLGALSNQTWLVKTLDWCSLQEAELACDEDSIIKVKSAFYRRVQKPDCKPAHSDKSVTCPPNALELLGGTCDERRHCDVPAKVHEASCPENPFTFIRVRYECVAGTPKVDDAFLGDGATEVATTGTTTTTSPKEKPREPQTPRTPLQEVNAQEADQEVTVLPQGGNEATSSTSSTTSTMLIRGDQVVKAEVQQELANIHQILAIKPCYRFTRVQRIRALSPLARLTTCDGDEGCFKVDFDDGRRYTAFEEEPEAHTFLSGHLVAGDDSWRVSFLGIGLERNDYGTWGVCLPKTEGLEFAVSMFHGLQAVHAALAGPKKL